MRVQARSPYHIAYTDTNLTQLTVELFIYTGTQTTDRPVATTYVFQIEAWQERASMDIGQYVQDALTNLFDGSPTSQMVWVDYRLTPYISDVEQSSLTIVQLEGYSGYREHIEGAQNESSAEDTNTLLMSNSTIYRPAGKYLTIPIIKDSDFDVAYLDASNNIIYSQTITPSVVSSSRISYLNDSGTAGVDSYKERVLADGGDFVMTECLNNLLCLDMNGLSKIIVDGTEIKIETLLPSKYPQYKITFVNRFGALQDIWFTGKNVESMKTSVKNTYRRSTLVNDSYDVSRHTQVITRKNGAKSLQLSTAFVDESFNETFKELQLSLFVWIEIEGVTLPVTVKDSGMVYKNSVNDGLIAFKLDIEFSFNEISDILQ